MFYLFMSWKTMKTQTCNYVICPERSQVSFTISHLVLSKVSGQFTRLHGCAAVRDLEFVDYALLKIDVSSIRTGNSIRDRNLMKKDYFNAATYKFIECCVRDLDIKNFPDQPVDFHIKIKDIEEIVPLNVFVISTNNETVSLRITGKIRTQDFGLKWQSPFKPGLMVGSEVNLNVYLSLFKGQTTPESLGNNPSQSSSAPAASHRK
ncbi:conserved hypothetical protein [Thermoplasma acidophilum]|uniref:Lipid/polyisoprenoid-binding YceI-like domain-containing protein n=2 Tax=Thermoplasma acidophilum TaxID=2303 RepID=Q9HIU7_THEAC|nr:conserved hypothetical protein [Thermoplasma acidophilum]